VLLCLEDEIKTKVFNLALQRLPNIFQILVKNMIPQMLRNTIN